MKKLFWDDPYATTCKAKVVSVAGNTVTLDQSIFYAFSGGQASDKGTIGGIAVVEARKQGDKEDIVSIEYDLASEPSFKVGDTVEVLIDWEHRYKLMRLHSAAHLVWYPALEILGSPTVIGSNISPDKARFDFLFSEPLGERVAVIEKKVNELIAKELPIVTEYDSTKPDLRWWRCSGFEMPCGGTHVKSTKEIGSLKLKRKNIGAGKERIEIMLTT